MRFCQETEMSFRKDGQFYPIDEFEKDANFQLIIIKKTDRRI